MKAELLNSIAKDIEEAGLKRHILDDAPNLHHYVVEINYKKPDEKKIMDELPEPFESVCENENKDGSCDGTFMFYLEDIEEYVKARNIVDWLKSHNGLWSNVDFPSCLG